MSPIVDLVQARSYDAQGKFDEAIPYYESAIDGFSKKKTHIISEYKARCFYGLMLGEYATQNKAQYIEKAQRNLDAVILFIRDNQIKSCSLGVSLRAKAKTLQLQASYSENEEEFYSLLERAYWGYFDAVVVLKESKEWHSLAYTYYNLGETSDWYGDTDEAIKWIALAVELDKIYGFDKDLIEGNSPN